MALKIKKQEYISKTFRLPADLLDELAEVAQKNEISMTQLIVALCKYGLENLDDENRTDS